MRSNDQYTAAQSRELIEAQQKREEAGRIVAVLPVPPLSQSRQALMACPHLYVETHVHGIQRPSNEYAQRGGALHQILARYVHHLVEKRVPTDPAALDEIAAGVDLDNEGRDIIDHLRESFYLDPEKVADVERYLCLDAYLNPIDSETPEGAGIADYFIPDYEGTLDLVLMHSPTEAEIPDWKSYYQVIDADTFQSKLYPLLLFKHNPKLEKVTFRLEFIRWGVGRSVEWHRSDVPKLEAIVKAERARQLAFHEPIEETRAVLPGKHCAWCPKLKSCPLGDTNPMTRDPQERVRFAIWVDHVRKENLDTLKAHVNVQGPITVTDGNGTKITAGFHLIEKSEYPLLPTLGVITEWAKTAGEDITEKLRVGATQLNSLAKAKKRADLKTSLDTVKCVNATTRFGVGKDDDCGDE